MRLAAMTIGLMLAVNPAAQERVVYVGVGGMACRAVTASTSDEHDVLDNRLGWYLAGFMEGAAQAKGAPIPAHSANTWRGLVTETCQRNPDLIVRDAALMVYYHETR